MKLKQLFGEGSDHKYGDVKKTKSENEEMTAITDKDYKTWLKQVGKVADHEEFTEVAFSVMDNDPKLGSTPEAKKAEYVRKLWKLYQAK